jgi:hypothetical protein
MLRRIGGYAHSWDRETGKVRLERDTFTCNHCNKITHVVPFCHPEDLGGFCRLCDKLICKDCSYLMSLGKPCTPMYERLLRLERHMDRGGVFRDVDTFAKE